METNDLEGNSPVLGFAAQIVQEAKKRKIDRVTVQSNYRCTNHINPTSNTVERLFSRAKLIMSERRRSTSPYHLELLLFLRSNKDLWDAATIQECFDPITPIAPVDANEDEV